MSLTLVDLLIVVFVILSTLNGWRNGLVRQVVSLVAVFLSYLVARSFDSMFVPVVAKFIPAPTSTGGALVSGLIGSRLDASIAFVILFLATFVIIRLAGGALDLLAKLPGLSILNRVTGAALGFLLAVFICGIVINVLLLVPSQPLQNAIHKSQIAPSLEWKNVEFLPQLHSALDKQMKTKP